MIKKYVLLFAFLFIKSKVDSQTATFELLNRDTTNNSTGFSSINGVNDIINTSDDNFLILAHTWTTNVPWDLCLLKLNKNGDTLWTKCFGFNNGEYFGNSIFKTADNGFIMGGLTQGFGSNKVIVLKTDSTGNIQWSKIIGAGYCIKIKQTNDKGFIIFGENSYSYEDFLLLKLDSTGTFQWEKTYYTLDSLQGWVSDFPYSFENTYDNGFIMIGGSQISLQHYIFVIRTDSIGNVLWSKFYKEPSTGSFGHDIIRTNDYGYLIAGTYGPFASLIFMKIDSTGNLSWVNSYSNNFLVNPGRLAITTDSNFIYSSSVKIGNTGNWDYLIIKFDSLGNILWNKIYGGSGNNFLGGCIQTSDGSIFMGGNTTSFPGYSMYLIKTDDMGNGVCNDSSLAFTKSPLNFITTIPNALVMSSNPVTMDTTGYRSTFYVGHFLCSNVGINEYMHESLEIQIYPNPTTGKLTIQSANERINQITITSLSGQIIFKKDFLGSPSGVRGFEIDLRKEAKGIYLIQAITDKEVYNHKIILN